MKVVEAGNDECQRIHWTDKTYFCIVKITDDKIFVSNTYISEATQEYEVDMTSQYRIIKIVVSGTSLTVYVDGVSRITGTLDNSNASGALHWGDISGGSSDGGECYWDYIRYKCN